MGYTRATLLAHVETMFGDTSSNTDTFLESALNNAFYYLWDAHDWTFKHKTGSFSTVAGTETKDLSASSTDIRSSEDVELMYDSTNGKVLHKVDLREFRKAYPKEDTSGKPQYYAPWGSKTIYMSPEPDGIYTIKYLYLSKPTVPTADADDLETTCGLPDYIQPLLLEIVVAHMMRYLDDSRYAQQQQLIEQVLLPRAIQADMKHLESGARIKFWEEELERGTVSSFSDFIGYVYSNNYGRNW